MVPTLHESILVVVDVQLGFISPASAPAVPVIADLAMRWQRAGGATVFTKFVNSQDSAYVRVIGWGEMMPGTPSVDFAPEIEPLTANATLVVEKGSYSAMTPEVMKLIDATGKRHVWVVGLDTESCVLATTFSAFDANLDPWIVTDACASHAGPTVHAAGLLVASRNLGAGRLVTTADVPAEVIAS